MNYRILFILFFFAILSGEIIAQISLIKSGKPHSRIIITENNDVDEIAAGLLQRFVQKISGCQLSVVINGTPRKGDILIGDIQCPLFAESQSRYSELNEDGFLLLTEGGYLRVLGGGGKGVIYGVVTLLEQYLGMNYWAEKEYAYPSSSTISLPYINKVNNPAFRYRQVNSYSSQSDSIYKLWYRLDEPSETFVPGYWVHTFEKLLPVAVYGDKHPEYYSFFNGKRHPGKGSQWCLTNPEVFEIVSQRIDSIFKACPDRKLIGVSQNDGNNANCTCENCRAIDEREGSPSGSIIYFMNKLAARFPDKEFATLAYLYSVVPPKYMKPLPNVVIMLCDIDCTREVSLTENTSGKKFVKALEGWSAITDNIFIWDYGINFDNYLSPFPNFHILQDNIKLFKAHNTTMHLSQISATRGGDFSELRAYLVGKLVWNPEVDTDSLTNHFLIGYYGKASSYIYQYINLMQGALISSGQRLWIYDSPVSHKSGMLKPELLKRYNLLFDAAEQAVAHDSVYLDRVQRTRLSLMYSELEIARTELEKEPDELERKLSLFEERIKKFEVSILNERRNSPLDYCALYRPRYITSKEKSKVFGAKVIFLTEPSERYKKMAQTALTDGFFGGATFTDSWIGWEGVDASFIVDLGGEKEIQEVETDFLHQPGQWVFFPSSVSYSYSVDEKTYIHWETHQLQEDRALEVKFIGVKTKSTQTIKARYIKVEVTGGKLCPNWHGGVGRPSWFFVDEVSVF